MKNNTKTTWLKNALLLCTLVLTVGAGTIVKAETHRETEPNDTMEQAEEIKERTQSMEEYHNGDNTNSYVVKGSTSMTDPDWYKVYLFAGSKIYFSLDRSAEVMFTITDGSGNDIYPWTENRYGDTTYSAYEVNISGNGYYYIGLKGDTKYSESYSFSIGTPVYRSGNIKLSNNKSITLSSGNPSYAEIYDLKYQNLPKGGIVYQMCAGGFYTGDVGQLKVSCSTSSTDISTTVMAYISNLKIPFGYGYETDGRYTVTYSKGTGTKTFTPDMTFYYVYPILP